VRGAGLQQEMMVGCFGMLKDLHGYGSRNAGVCAGVREEKIEREVGELGKQQENCVTSAMLRPGKRNGVDGRDAV
jgi:hypothetical protein